MNLCDVFSEYNVNIDGEKYPLEFFIEDGNYRVYHLDFLPKPVKSPKYDEVEVLYTEAVHNSSLMSRYIHTENRFTNTMIKLWLYSDVLVNVDTVYLPKKKIKSSLEKRHKKYASAVVEQDTYSELREICHAEEMEFYTALSCRSIANVVWYFRELGVLVFSNFSCLSMVFLKDEGFDFVKSIAKSEGLFLRIGDLR